MAWGLGTLAGDNDAGLFHFSGAGFPGVLLFLQPFDGPGRIPNGEQGPHERHANGSEQGQVAMAGQLEGVGYLARDHQDGNQGQSEGCDDSKHL